MEQNFNLIAKTFMGLEPVLAKELTQLGANDVQIGRRMVSFTGDKELMYRANFQLHTAIRILKPIRHFKAKSADDVYEEIKKIDATKFCKELVVHPAGVGGKTEEKSFVVLTNNLEGGYVSNITSQEASITETIRILSLDEANINVRGKLFIKMDIEGAELDALKGGRKLIYENRPYLAICLYHRKNDIIDIPLYLNSFLENYDFYLEGGYHTILIGVPK